MAPSAGGLQSAPLDPSDPTPAPLLKLAFMSTRDGNSEIYVMHGTGAVQVNLTNDPVADDYLPSWSPDGKRIAFIRSAEFGNDDFYGNHRLFVMNADGTAVVDLSGTLGAVPNQIVDWSPDGSTIAFSVILPPPGGPDIWLVHPDGSGLVPLTPDDLGNRGADWSPDGSKIAFVRTGDGDKRTEDGGIYVIAADGTGLTQLTADAWERSVKWSPSGRQIAFARSSFGGETDIWMMNADGSGETNLTNHPAADDSPSWSPSGDRIAFTSTRTGSGQVFRMHPDGSYVTQLTMLEYNTFPVWSPEGGYIAFVRRPAAGGDFNIWRMKASGADQIQLTTEDYNTTPSWKGSK